jgi:hypothetical protein
MRPSPPIDDSYNPCHPRLAPRRPRPNLHPSSGLARVGVANPVGKRADRSFAPCARLEFVANRPQQQPLSNLFKPSPAAKSP